MGSRSRTQVSRKSNYCLKFEVFAHFKEGINCHGLLIGRVQ